LRSRSAKGRNLSRLERKNLRNSQIKTPKSLEKSRTNKIKDSTRRCFATKTEETGSLTSEKMPKNKRRRIKRRNSSLFYSSR
jgi:hypothetical protein